MGGDLVNLRPAEPLDLLTFSTYFATLVATLRRLSVKLCQNAWLIPRGAKGIYAVHFQIPSHMRSIPGCEKTYTKDCTTRATDLALAKRIGVQIVAELIEEVESKYRQRMADPALIETHCSQTSPDPRIRGEVWSSSHRVGRIRRAH